MKKARGIILLLVVSLLFSTCLMTPSIKFSELSSNVFTLKQIDYMTDIQEYSQDIQKVFKTLPVNDTIKQLESKYNIKIDTSLYDNYTEQDIKVGSMLGNPVFGLVKDTEEKQIIWIRFVIWQHDKDFQALSHLVISENGKDVSEQTDTFHYPDWSPNK